MTMRLAFRLARQAEHVLLHPSPERKIVTLVYSIVIFLNVGFIQIDDQNTWERAVIISVTPESRSAFNCFDGLDFVFTIMVYKYGIWADSVDFLTKWLLGQEDIHLGVKAELR